MKFLTSLIILLSFVLAGCGSDMVTKRHAPKGLNPYTTTAPKASFGRKRAKSTSGGSTSSSSTDLTALAPLIGAAAIGAVVAKSVAKSSCRPAKWRPMVVGGLGGFYKDAGTC